MDLHDIKLTHYAGSPLDTLYNGSMDSARQRSMGVYAKPCGLWVSVDDVNLGWYSWCRSENFQLQNLIYKHDIFLRRDANILLIQNLEEFDAFTAEYLPRNEDEADAASALKGAQLDMSKALSRRIGRRRWDVGINWKRVSERYQGIIITPYQWERRLPMTDEFSCDWYYAWDCASGCIWDVSCVERVICHPETEVPEEREYGLESSDDDDGDTGPTEQLPDQQEAP